MASRQSKQTLGTPYQIYSEIANAGKNLASTKRRISWRFGWSEGEGNHEIMLVHSIVSGKKVKDNTYILNPNKSYFIHEIF
jgi:hypothetical protein